MSCSRREFFSEASAFALGARGLFAAPPGWKPSKKPNLVLGVISDTHMRTMPTSGRIDREWSDKWGEDDAAMADLVDGTMDCDPPRPFFMLRHDYPPSTLLARMKRHPNAVGFFGHLHYSIANWRKVFLADGNPDSRVYAYEVVVAGDEQKLHKVVYAAGCNMGVGHEPNGGMTDLSIPRFELPPGDALTIAARPLTSLGTRGRLLVTKTFFQPRT